MSLNLAPPSAISVPAASIFTTPAFRLALAREYRLVALDANLDTKHKQLSIPVFVKHKTLIIGAGFDKTGLIQGLEPEDSAAYAQSIDVLLQQLPEQQPQLRYLQWRTTHSLPCLQDHSDKLELLVELDKPCAERIMDFSKSTRRNIRMPFKQGFQFEIANRPDLLDAFYQLYLQNMHELGSLPHSKRFFTEISLHCPDQVRFFVGYLDQQPVVASLLLLSDDEAYGAWSGTHPAYKQQNVFLSMLWSIVEFCEQTGRKRYNLGRSSRGSGACEFKMRLANRVNPIYYYRLPVLNPTTARPRLQTLASWVIRHSPPLVMQTLSRNLLQHFY